MAESLGQLPGTSRFPLAVAENLLWRKRPILEGGAHPTKDTEKRSNTIGSQWSCLLALSQKTIIQADAELS
jgi:hypothetical protein